MFSGFSEKCRTDEIELKIQREKVIQRVVQNENERKEKVTA